MIKFLCESAFQLVIIRKGVDINGPTLLLLFACQQALLRDDRAAKNSQNTAGTGTEQAPGGA